jgi:flagellar basal-body rod modification protein FlgD
MAGLARNRWSVWFSEGEEEEMISSVTGTSGTNIASESMKQATGMNKNDFLQLLVTQLKSQDPLNPQDSSQFVAQLAQLTQVEQMYNINSNLQNLLSSQNNFSSISSLSMIGKEITTVGSSIVLTDGSQPDIPFSLATDANQLTVTIKDATGRTVRTISQGQTSAGVRSIQWDGKDDNGQPLAAGKYSFEVSGVDAAGQTITATPLFRGRVTGVNLEGDVPLLTVNGISVPLTSILEVKEVSV